MKLFNHKTVVSSLLLNLSFHSSLSAQIIPNTTLPNSSSVEQQGNRIEIDGGTRPQMGSNLFHSFEQFSVGRGQTAVFNNSVEIQNIFSRVTGKSRSQIDGTIQTQGGANLFLINPNGIIFGKDAELNIGGSFFATTAENIHFADGTQFSAVDTHSQPLLTVSVPIGLGFGLSPGEIVNQSSNGLKPASGKTIALVGGSVSFDGGYTIAEQGRIEIGSFAPNSYVTFDSTQGWKLTEDETSLYRDVDLSQEAAIYSYGGDINIQARRIFLRQGSTIYIQADEKAGNLILKASELVQLDGSLPEESSNPASLLNIVENNAIGEEGILSIETQRLVINQGAEISVNTYGTGQGVDLIVKASESVELSGTSVDGIPSGLFARVESEATGDGGTIIIETKNLIVSDGALVSTDSIGFGQAGDLIVKASESVELSGNSVFITGLFARASSDETRVVPSAGEVLITEFAPDDFFTLTEADSGQLPTSTGDGGNLVVETDQLIVSNGAQISTSTHTAGDAGNLTIRAKTIELNGFYSQGSSGLFASAIQGSGKGGDLNVFANKLTIANGATINVGNFQSQGTLPPGTGSPGDININVEEIYLNNGGTITAETLLGSGGNITVTDADTLLLLNNSQITTNATESATGGNIGIDSDVITLLDNSNITANAVEGDGGNIQITTKSIFQSLNSQITASSEFGIDGEININSPEIDPGTGLLVIPATIVDSTRLIAQTCSSSGEENEFIITGRGGLPPNPTEIIQSNTDALVDLGEPIVVQSSDNSQPQSQPNPHTAPATKPIIEAAGAIVTPAGKVFLTANLPDSAQSSEMFENAECR